MTRTLSLLTPTGRLTLGNLLGALRPMAAAQHDADCFYGIADLHALTTAARPAPAARARPRRPRRCCSRPASTAATLFRAEPGAGAHPARLPARVHRDHRRAEPDDPVQGEGARASTRPGVSLYTYPALMAADILLYRPAPGAGRRRTSASTSS